MITINFTLIVEIILFLTFFVISHRLIWSPLIQTIREREKYFKSKEDLVQKTIDEINHIHDIFTKEKLAIQKKMEKEIDDTIKNAYQRQRTIIELEQKQVNDELYKYRIHLREKFCLSEEQMQPFVDEIAEEIYRWITQRKRLI